VFTPLKIDTKNSQSKSQDLRLCTRKRSVAGGRGSLRQVELEKSRRAGRNFSVVLEFQKHP
jgi:hypothetical protein